MRPEATEAGTPGKKRILFVTQTNGYGGTELHLLRLLESFGPSSIQATIVCLAGDPYTNLLKSNLGIQAHVCRASRPKDFRGYWRLIRGFRPEIVVFVSGWHGLFPLTAYLAARLAMARRVCTVEHSAAVRRSPWPKTWVDPMSVLRWIAGWHARTTLTGALVGRVSDQTICVSEASRMRLVQEYAYPRRKTSAVRHGVDPSQYAYLPKMRLVTRTSLGIGPEECVLVFVGRLHPDKGADILFESLCRLRQAGFPCKCIVVGDGPLRSELAAFVAGNGLSPTVMFLGFQEDVRPYLAAADIFALPSRTEAGPPFSLIEAMSSGLACIVADVCGVREAISDGVDGLIVPPESGAAITEAVCRLLSDTALRSSIGKRARERIKEAFDERTSLAQVRQLLLDSELGVAGTVRHATGNCHEGASNAYPKRTHEVG